MLIVFFHFLFKLRLFTVWKQSVCVILLKFELTIKKNMDAHGTTPFSFLSRFDGLRM